MAVTQACLDRSLCRVEPSVQALSDLSEGYEQCLEYAQNEWGFPYDSEQVSEIVTAYL